MSPIHRVSTEFLAWAGGETDYSAGPYNMYMKSMSVTDYSTGSSYSYSDQSGTWESITSEGGQVNGNSDAAPMSTESAPAVTATVESGPIPFSGTHRETSSFVTPDVWPWVPTGSAAASEPSDWPKSGSGQPTAGACASEQCRPSYCLPESPAKTDVSSQSVRPSAASVSSSASSSHYGLKHHSTKTTSMSSTISMTSVTFADTDSEATDSPSVGTTSATHAGASNTPHVAPAFDAANSMLKVPSAMGAFCMLVGGGLAMF